MYDINKLKPALLKYKYETAIEKDGERVTYAELNARIRALSNALERIAADSIAVLVSDPYTLILTAFAVSLSGKHAVLADEKISLADATIIAQSVSPSLVIFSPLSYKRTSEIFYKSGCKNAILTGKNTDLALFPSVFEFDRLLCENDYEVSRRDAVSGSIEFYERYTSLHTLADLDRIDRRDGIHTDFVPYECIGAYIISEILYSGHKLCQTPTKKTKHKIYAPHDAHFINGKVFNKPRLEKLLCEITGGKITCDCNGEKITVTAYADDKAEAESVMERTKTAVRDVLYPFDCAKAVRVVKNA